MRTVKPSRIHGMNRQRNQSRYRPFTSLEIAAGCIDQ